jgi:hypothetical protein
VAPDTLAIGLLRRLLGSTKNLGGADFLESPEPATTHAATDGADASMRSTRAAASGLGHSDFSDAMSIEKRYFTSDFRSR